MKTLIAVRNVDKDTFRKFRAKSVEDGISVGDALTKAMSHWLQEGNRAGQPNPRMLKELVGLVKPGEKVRWSEEIDEILYGGRT